MADRKFAAFKANVTELLRRKKWDVFLFDKLLRPTYAVSAKQAVSQVWHVDIVPQYGPSRMDEAKALRRANMHAELAEGQAKKKKKSPSHSIQRSLFAH